MEQLQNRDYSKVKDPSLLRFLVDIRGADVTDVQLRDDLMTMLIAGHETTAAVLTWCLFCLVQDKALLAEVIAEIDQVLGPAAEQPRAPTYDEIMKLELTRLCLAEALRLYPEPPILIRRCLEGKGLSQSPHSASLIAHTRLTLSFLSYQVNQAGWVQKGFRFLDFGDVALLTRKETTEQRMDFIDTNQRAICESLRVITEKLGEMDQRSKEMVGGAELVSSSAKSVKRSHGGVLLM